jgi:hypothetical protein
MEWINATTSTELSNIRSNRNPVIGEFNTGQIACVYWNSYDWVICDTITEQYPDGISVYGDLLRYIKL